MPQIERRIHTAPRFQRFETAGTPDSLVGYSWAFDSKVSLSDFRLAQCFGLSSL